MNFLIQIAHFLGVSFLDDLGSRSGSLRLGLRPLPLRCFHLCLLSVSAIISPLQADEFQLGLEAYHESQYTEAIEAFERSLESSESAATHHNLALSLYQQGQTDLDRQQWLLGGGRVACATTHWWLPAPSIFKTLFRHRSHLPSFSSHCADDSNHAAAFRDRHFQGGCRAPPRPR